MEDWIIVFEYEMYAYTYICVWTFSCIFVSFLKIIVFEYEIYAHTYICVWTCIFVSFLKIGRLNYRIRVWNIDFFGVIKKSSWIKNRSYWFVSISKGIESIREHSKSVLQTEKLISVIPPASNLPFPLLPTSRRAVCSSSNPPIPPPFQGNALFFRLLFRVRNKNRRKKEEYRPLSLPIFFFFFDRKRIFSLSINFL